MGGDGCGKDEPLVLLQNSIAEHNLMTAVCMCGVCMYMYVCMCVCVCVCACVYVLCVYARVCGVYVVCV